MGYFLIALWACFYAYWVYSARNAAPVQYGDVNTDIFMFPLVAAYLILIITPIFTEPIGTLWALPFVILGMMLAVWSRRVLGASWHGLVTIQQGHRLVTHGPYRYLRHPIYVGVFFALTATAIFIGGVALLAPPLVLWAFYFKGKNEERQLALFFPEYDIYRRSTYL